MKWNDHLPADVVPAGYLAGRQVKIDCQLRAPYLGQKAEHIPGSA